MPRLTRIILLSLLCLAWPSHQALAQSYQGSLDNEKIYFLTYESCREFAVDKNPLALVRAGLNPQGIDVLLGTMGDVNLAVDRYMQGDNEALRTLKYHRGLGAYMDTLLHSEGFIRATEDCFPNERNNTRKKAYVASLLTMDAAAKFALTAPMAIGGLRTLKWAHSMFHKTWVKALFLAQLPLYLSGSVRQSERSYLEQMTEQFQNLSSQIDLLVIQNNSERKR